MSHNILISLRVDDARRTLIERAAETAGKNSSEFILDAASSEAKTILVNRCYFALEARAFKRFAAALDAPPAANPRLRKLLAMNAPWER